MSRVYAKTISCDMIAAHDRDVGVGPANTGRERASIAFTNSNH